MSCRRPNTSLMVLANLANAGARQSFFDVIFDPGAFEIAVKTIVGSNPDAAVLRAQHGIDAVKPSAHVSPISAVKLPDSVFGGAPDSAVVHFDEREFPAGKGLIIGGEGTPLLVVLPGDARIRAEQEITIARIKHTQQIISNR